MNNPTTLSRRLLQRLLGDALDSAASGYHRDSWPQCEGKTLPLTRRVLEQFGETIPGLH